MSRIYVSIGIVIALIALSAAGPCLACSTSSPGTSSQSSCCHHGRCDNPAKAPPPQACSAPDLNAATIEKTSPQIDHTALDLAQIVEVPQSQPIFYVARLSAVLVIRHAPPDLCLLNSVLTI